MKTEQAKDLCPIPDDVLIAACNETSKKFGKGVDSWGEEERCYARRLCGDKYKHIESDLVGKKAINLRKSNRLEPIKKGKTKRPLIQPAGGYAQYLSSDHWRNFRRYVLQFWGFRCSVCGAKKSLEVHHNTYARVGEELLQDCIPVCRDCHKAIHFRMPDGNDQFGSSFLSGLDPEDKKT